MAGSRRTAARRNGKNTSASPGIAGAAAGGGAARPPAGGTRARLVAGAPTLRASGGTPLPWLKPGLFVGGLAPLAVWVFQALRGSLGANPIADAENVLGLATLVFLLATLACTPARRLFGWTWPARVRRQLGLFAFFYVALHFLTYVVVDQGLDAGRIADDIVKRPFITVGFAALVLLTPLALTSTTSSIRRLGYRRWTLLHQLAYIAAVLAVIHFFWRVKLDVSQPLAYGSVLAALFVVRLLFWMRRRAPARGLQ